MDLQERSPSPVQPRAPATFTELSAQDLPLLAEAMGLPNMEPLLQRVEARRRCFAACVGEDIAAYGWVSQSDEWIGEQERCIRISSEEAYIWDCVTLPDYRRQRLYSALLSHMLSVLKREGTQRVWIGTAVKNRPSIKGFANAGFRPVLDLLHLRLFSLRAWWLASPAKHSEQPAPDYIVEAAYQALVRKDERRLGPLIVRRSPASPAADCVERER